MKTITDNAVSFRASTVDELKDLIGAVETIGDVEGGYTEIFAYTDRGNVFRLRRGDEVDYTRLKISEPRRKYAGIWSHIDPDELDDDAPEQQNFDLDLSSVDYFEVQFNER